MTPIAFAAAPVILVSGVVVVLVCGVMTSLLLLDVDISWPRLRGRRLTWLERERDLAGNLGWSARRWMVLRVAVFAVALSLGVASGVSSLAVILLLLALFGVRFAVAGRAAKRRLRMERAFLGQLQIIRDRMAVANQSLDTALQEMGKSPPSELAFVLEPMRQGGSIVENIVRCGERSRSPLIEQACGVLLWARSRSLDALIVAIDEVLMPIGEAQLAVEEESLVTLTQQRAVAMAMGALMAFMVAAILRVDSFRAYYSTVAGTIVVITAFGLFFLLILLLGRIVRVTPWTRWNLRLMAAQEARPHG